QNCLRSIVRHMPDASVGKVVTRGQTAVFRQREAEAEAATQLPNIERRFILLVGTRCIGINTGRQVPTEEVRLGEAEVDFLALEAQRCREANELALAEQVALGDADRTNNGFRGRITGGEVEGTCGLLFNLDSQHHAVRRTAWLLD